MPIRYGQVKGRKYPADQPLYVPEEETKVCTKCGREKPLWCFSKDRTRRDGLRSECSECEAEMRMRRRK